MRTLIHILSVAVVFVCGCHRDSAHTANPPLSFFVVSEGNIEGGRFIDAPDFPKLGYIAASPDLAIAHLDEVTAEQTPPGLTIRMNPDDAKKFAAITERAVGKQILIMLGDKPLTAPRVNTSIPGGIVALTFGGKTDNKKIEDELKQLTKQ